MDDLDPPGSEPTPERRDPTEPLSAVHLRRPPFWSIGLMVLTAMAGVLVVNLMTKVIGQLQHDPPPDGLGLQFLFIFALVSFVSFVIGRRAYIRAKPLSPIRFHDDCVELPRSVQSLGTRKVPYAEILSVLLGGYPPNLRVLVESRRDIFFFDQPFFKDPSGPELVFFEMRRRILRLPEGRAIMEAMQKRQEIAGRAMGKRPWVTQILLGVIVIIFANLFLMDQGISSPIEGGFDLMLLVGWGANYGPLIHEGEYYRLLAANFLHGGTLHVAVNCISLWSLGGVMERFVGWERYLLIYLAAGLGAMVASMLFAEMPSVGASGCIFGIFGGFALLNLRYRTMLPIPLRQTRRWWTFIIGLTLVLHLIPNLDAAGHIGGFVTGALLTWLLLARPGQTPVLPPQSNAVRSVALGMAAMFAVGIGASVYYASSYDRDTEVHYATRLARDLTASGSEIGSRLNLFAWVIAIHPKADEDDLSAAEKAAELAIETPDDLGILFSTLRAVATALGPADTAAQERAQTLAKRDTLATIYYRQGKLAEAVKMQREILESSPEFTEPRFGQLWSQLERFIAAWREEHGFEPTGPLGATLAVQREQGRRATIALDLVNGPTHNSVIYALVRRGERRIGLLRVVVPSGVPLHSTFSPPEITLGKSTGIDIAIVDSYTDLVPKDGKTTWEFWPTDPTVATYP